MRRKYAVQVLEWPPGLGGGYLTLSRHWTKKRAIRRLLRLNAQQPGPFYRMIELP